MNHLTDFKIALAAACATLSALWGWVGWLIVAWIVLMGIDYVTGSAAALRSGTWSSSVAREGLWHKSGSMFAVVMAGILDLTIQLLLTNAGIDCPVKAALLPLCTVWYLLTEAGSILENVGAMGAPLPVFLVNAIKVLRDKVDDAGEDVTQ